MSGFPLKGASHTHAMAATQQARRPVEQISLSRQHYDGFRLTIDLWVRGADLSRAEDVTDANCVEVEWLVSLLGQ